MDVKYKNRATKLSYVVSLEDASLDILPKFTYRRRYDTVPLWSSPPLAPREHYFEFELDDYGDSNEWREKASSQHCHICDVNVPTAYWDEHRGSARHRACTTIAEISMDRTQRVISMEMQTVSRARETRAREGTYYCPSCSCAVSLTKRYSHELSDGHAQSVMHDKLIESLSLLYKTENNLKTVCEEIFKSNYEKVTNELQMKQKFNSNKKVATDINSSNTDKKENGKPYLKTVEKTKTDIDQNQDLNKIIYKQPGKEKTNDYFVETTDDLNELICVICNVKLSNKNERLKEHASALNHEINRKKLLKDNFMENIDSATVFCAFCNATFLVTNELDHVKSKKHLKQYLIYKDEVSRHKGDTSSL